MQPFAVRLLSNVSDQFLTFFPVIIVCILLKCYFLDFHWIIFPFRSDISVNRFCTNGQQMDVRNIRQPFVHKWTTNWRPKYSSTVCAQMFGWRFVHKCSSAQIVHRNIRRSIHRTANEQQTDIRNIRQPFDICNFLLCRFLYWETFIM